MQPKGLAISALVVGIVAFVIAWIPVLGIAGIIAGAVAVVLGIIAAVKKQPKGYAITGIVLGALAVIGGLIITITLGAMLGQLSTELENLDDITIEEIQE